MASLQQNISIFDKDKVTIRFIVTDNETDLDQASARAWWGVGENAGDTGTLTFEKINSAWGGSNPSQDDDPDSPPATSPNIVLGASTIDCFLTQSDFGTDITEQEDLYHELVYSGPGQAAQSSVVATGDFTILPSLFTLKGYR